MTIKKKNTLRIAHYNIFNGGKDRLSKIQKVIKTINPDVCGILEAVEWQDKNKYFKYFAKKLGYKFYYLAIANSKYNIALFSKIYIKVKYIKKGFRHVVIHATIEEGEYDGLNIFFIHLSPISEDERLKELKELFKLSKKFSRLVIMGDFNSLSPHDLYNKKKLLSFFRKNNIKKYGVENLRFDLIQKIESLGFIDSMKYLKKPFTFSVPTLSNTDINHSAKIRVDYAFVSKDISKNLLKIKFIKNKISNKASDHYPLFIELK